MKKLFKSILIAGSLLAASGLCHGDVKFLHAPESFGGAQFVEHCLKNGVNLVDEKTGESLLHFAASNGRIDDVLRMIDNGTDVDLKAKNGETALCCAVFKHHVELARLLVEKGASINTAVNIEGGRFKITPLIAAVSRNSLQLVESLISQEEDLGIVLETRPGGHFSNAFFTAIGLSNVEILDMLLNARPNTKLGTIVGFWSYLGHAIQSKNRALDMVNLLIKNKANLNDLVSVRAIDGMYLPPLAYVIAKIDEIEECVEIAEALVLAGANVNSIGVIINDFQISDDNKFSLMDMAIARLIQYEEEGDMGDSYRLKLIKIIDILKSAGALEYDKLINKKPGVDLDLEMIKFNPVIDWMEFVVSKKRAQGKNTKPILKEITTGLEEINAKYILQKINQEIE